MSAFDSTITSLLPDWPALPPAKRTAIGQHCAHFARQQISQAPAHIRLGLRTLFFTFVAFAAARAIARGSSPFTTDAAALAAFADLGPAACAALERALRSMTVLAFLEHPVVLAAIEGEQPPR
jgi:hypothetical protein